MCLKLVYVAYCYESLVKFFIPDLASKYSNKYSVYPSLIESLSGRAVFLYRTDMEPAHPPEPFNSAEDVW